MGTLAMLGGRLNDRFGPRPVLAATGVLYGLGYLLLGRIAEPWQIFVLMGTLIGLGLSTHDVVTLSTVARLFQARRGIMSGVIKTGTALGQVAIPPVAAALIVWLGWRGSLTALGLATSVLLVLAALCMSRPPAPERPAGASPVALPGVTFAQARRSRVFWTLCAVQFLFFPTVTTVPLHLAVHSMDLGLSQPAAATLLSVIGGSSIAGRLVLGGLSDRIGGRLAISICLALLAAALAALTVTTAPGLLYPVVAVYGFTHGALFVVISPTVAEYFGMRAHGAIFGTVLFSGTLGGSIGPIVAGWVYDTTGGYTPAFVTLTLAAGLALLLVRSLPRPGQAQSFT